MRAAGITHINGDVAIDDRLWQPDPSLVGEDPGTDPILINDNVIDVQIRPTQQGQPAEVLWRPQTAAIRVDSQVTTGGPAKDPGAYPFSWELTQSESGDRVVATGTIPANAKPQLLTAAVNDPASFARTALIEALERAGVTVAAPSLDANPESVLPAAAYQAGDEVAAYTSPPFRQYTRLILKVSHNVGAQVSLCLLAVTVGSDDCEDGFGVERSFLRRAGVDLSEVALSDGRGGDPNNRLTPHATVQLLRWWMHRRDFRRFQHSLPILGVDGDLALSGRNSPARGKVFAKTGAAAGPDALNDRLVMAGKTMAGYLASKHGQARPFALFMSNGFFPADPAASFTASADLSRIAALMQQDESGAGR